MQDLLQEKVCVPPNTLPVPIFCKPLLTFDVNNGLHYYLFVIRSYANKVTEQIANGKTPRRIPKQVVQRALMRLIQLDNAMELKDLRFPQSNRLEKLYRDRRGQHSIRVNDQWRICFKLRSGAAYDVEFTDYH